jgi:hypothetical protein
MIRSFGVRIFFQAALQDDLDVGLGHGLAQLPMNDGARATLEQRAEKEKNPGEVGIGDIDVQVFVGCERLHKTLPLIESRIGGYHFILREARS